MFNGLRFTIVGTCLDLQQGTQCCDAIFSPINTPTHNISGQSTCLTYARGSTNPVMKQQRSRPRRSQGLTTYRLVKVEIFKEPQRESRCSQTAGGVTPTPRLDAEIPIEWRVRREVLDVIHSDTLQSAKDKFVQHKKGPHPTGNSSALISGRAPDARAGTFLTRLRAQNLGERPRHSISTRICTLEEVARPVKPTSTKAPTVFSHSQKSSVVRTQV